MSGSKRLVAAKGFTLIELLVVMTISGLLMALIGSMSLEQVERAERLSELNSAEQFVKNVAKQAAINKLSLSLVTEDSKLIIHGPLGQDINSIEFKHLRFQAQSIRFNRNGFADRQSMSVIANKRSASISLPTADAFDMSN